MRGPLLRKLVAVVGVCGLVGLALLPPEHVHLTEAPDGHHSDVVHRHYAPHHPIESHSNLDGQDHDIHWLDLAFTSPRSTPQQPLLNLVLSKCLQVLGPELTCDRAARVDDVSVHDPPPLGSFGLRAPPALSI